MTSTLPSRDWTDIRWPEMAGIDLARWIAVLPLAATEQHGPHLPLETDILIAQAYLARVRELLSSDLLVTFLNNTKSSKKEVKKLKELLDQLDKTE